MIRLLLFRRNVRSDDFGFFLGFFFLRNGFMISPRVSWPGCPFLPTLRNQLVKIVENQTQGSQEDTERVWQELCGGENVDRLTRPGGKTVWDKWQVKVHQAVGDSVGREQYRMVEHRLCRCMELTWNAVSTSYLLWKKLWIRILWGALGRTPAPRERRGNFIG